MGPYRGWKGLESQGSGQKVQWRVQERQFVRGLECQKRGMEGYGRDLYGTGRGLEAQEIDLEA